MRYQKYPNPFSFRMTFAIHDRIFKLETETTENQLFKSRKPLRTSTSSTIVPWKRFLIAKLMMPNLVMQVWRMAVPMMTIWRAAFTVSAVMQVWMIQSSFHDDMKHQVAKLSRECDLF